MFISTSGPVFNSKSMTFQGVCLLGSVLCQFEACAIMVAKQYNFKIITRNGEINYINLLCGNLEIFWFAVLLSTKPMTCLQN